MQVFIPFKFAAVPVYIRIKLLSHSEIVQLHVYVFVYPSLNSKLYMCMQAWPWEHFNFYLLCN